MLKINTIKKSFQKDNSEVKLFDDFSFEMLGGEFVALCGPSGCGKTTLMLMAGGLLAPDKGSIKFGDTDIYSISPEGRADFRAEKIGFVFQQFHLLPYLTVIDNIMVTNLAIPNLNIKEKADELLEELGLMHRSSHYPSELSIGERQRVALARALINRPQFILADEPTGNLDADNAEIVLSILRKRASEGNCVMMVTHSQEAAEKADRVERLPGKK